MNKKQLSVILSSIIFLNTAASLFAAPKKDVADPVLKEIITELSTSMPRFINKYGETVFVADEQITRGSLLAALYEYDKKISASKGISKKEFDALNNRLVLLEKGGGIKSAGNKSGANNENIVQLMADLEPNMPILLDSSLNNSKVFKDLRQKVELNAGLGGAGSGTSKTDNVALASLQKNMTDLNKRIDTFELAASSVKLNDKNASAVNNTALAGLQKDLTDLNKRIDSFELAASSNKSNDKNTLNQNSAKELGELRLSLEQIQRSYVNVSKRVDALEEKPFVASSGSGGNASNSQINSINAQLNSIKKTVADIPTNDDIRAQIDKTRNQAESDIKKIENRLNSLERSGVSSSDDSGSSKSSGTGTIAKISLGITMVAALFIAR